MKNGTPRPSTWMIGLVVACANDPMEPVPTSLGSVSSGYREPVSGTFPRPFQRPPDAVRAAALGAAGDPAGVFEVLSSERGERMPAHLRNAVAAGNIRIRGP